MTAIRLGPADAIREGAMQGYELADRHVLVAHIAGAYYCIDATCPHQGGDLSAGRLNGTIVTCPRHGSQFDVRDGALVKWVGMRPDQLRDAPETLKKMRPAVAYPVRAQDGDLFVDMA